MKIKIIIQFLKKPFLDAYNSWKEKNNKKREFDKVIYLKIKNDLLPNNKKMLFIKEFNFAWFSFKTSMLEKFFDIVDNELNNPELKFFDKKLEKLKSDLFNEIFYFIDIIITETFTNGQDSQVLPPEWEIKQPERFEKDVLEIHNRTDKIWEKYNKFLDYWKNKFVI